MSAAIKERASRIRVYRTDSLNPVTAVSAAVPTATERTTKRNFPTAARVSRHAMSNGNSIRSHNKFCAFSSLGSLAMQGILPDPSVSQDYAAFGMRGEQFIVRDQNERGAFLLI